MVMERIRKSERLLNLVAFLLKSRRPVGLAEIRESVVGYKATQVSAASVERRFERDKATLRELGVPLRFTREEELGGPGYVIPRDAYFLPRIELAPAEVAVLAAAGKLALSGAAGPVFDALASALRKLRFDSPIPGQIRQTAEEHFLFQTTEAEGNPAEQTNLRELTSAVLARRVVRFTYYTIGDDRIGKRVVEPYGLGFADGHWYLAGHDRDRDAVRIFRVDRVRGEIRRIHPDATRPEFQVPKDFRIADHVGVPPWLFGKAKKTMVRIRFDTDVAFMVRLRPATGDRWQDESDGAMILTRRVTNLDALLNWVLGFGRHAEVLEPPAFRERVIGQLQAVMAMHAGKSSKGAVHA